jgi:ankyrin repeat protein
MQFPFTCQFLVIFFDTTSPLSIAVAKGHFNIVEHILENTTDFDLSDTGKPPLFLAAEKGYYDILVLNVM